MGIADRRLERVHRFFSGTGATYDWMVNAATFGIDRRWKRRILDLIPPDASRILDLGCGTGISTLALANRFPTCRVVGVELREEYLDIAREKMASLDKTNVELVLSRAEDYRSDERFDCVVASYLAKYADLKSLARTTGDMLKPGGLILMHDFTFPPKAHLVWLFRLYFFVLQRLGSALFPSWREIFYGLPKLIEETRWVPELTEALRETGFVDIRTASLTAYGSAIVTARKDPGPSSWSPSEGTTAVPNRPARPEPASHPITRQATRPAPRSTIPRLRLFKMDSSDRICSRVAGWALDPTSRFIAL